MIKMFNSLTFLLKEALVRFLRQLSLELLYRLQRNTDDDDDSGSADTHGARQIRKQRNGMRQHRDERQADGAEHGDAAQHLVDIFLRLVARADARDIRAGFSQILCNFSRIDLHFCVEECKQDDQHDINAEAPAILHAQDIIHAIDEIIGRKEAGNLDRSHHQRVGEDDRNDAG